ncbi:MAG: VOC family protein [Bacteroidota bacterium]
MNLNQITIPSVDVPRAVTFYQTLGLQLIVDASPRYVRFLCPQGHSTLSIRQVEELPTGLGIKICFECEKIDQEVARLKAQGISFTLDPTDQTWLWREAHLNDPDGNALILFWAGENRVNPPWRAN